MKDKEIKEFSWTAFFLVTGFSFFLFSKILEWLDAIRLPVFTWIAVIAVLIGSLNSIRTFMEESER